MEYRIFLNWNVCGCVWIGKCWLTNSLASVIQAAAEQGLFVATIAMGFIAAFLSSIMNNMPTVMIDALAIAETNTSGLSEKHLFMQMSLGLT